MLYSKTPRVGEKNERNARHTGQIRKDPPGASSYRATERCVDAKCVAQIRMSVPVSTSESEGEWVYQSRSRFRKGGAAINHTHRGSKSGKKPKARNARKKETSAKRETQYDMIGGA